MPGGTEAIQLSAAILRNQAPDLVLRLGSTVAARVLERHGGRGLLSIGNAIQQVETGRSGIVTDFSSAGLTDFRDALKPDVSAPGGGALEGGEGLVA